MSFLSTLLRPFRSRASTTSEGRGELDDFWYGPVGTVSSAGVNVTPETAIQFSAVFASVRVIAESVAVLPLQVFKELDEGKDRAKDHPFARLLKRPNRWQTRYEFIETMTYYAVLTGNAFALIRSGEFGPVGELIPLDPAKMRVEQLPNLRLRYTYRWPDGQLDTWNQERVLHIRGLSAGGVIGLSPIDLARRSIGIGIASEEFSSRQWSQKPQMAGIMTHPETLSEEAGKRMTRSFDAASSGVNAERTVLLEEGTTWKATGMSNRDAEYVATRKFQITDIARWFRIPPHMVGDLDRATFSNIEQQALEFINYTLMPWIARWEGRIERDLILDDDHFAKFNVDALARAELLKRVQAYQIALNSRWLVVNDVRALEDMNPVPWGYEPNIPQGAPPPQDEPAADDDDPAPPPFPPDDDDEDAQASVQLNRIAAITNGNGASHE